MSRWKRSADFFVKIFKNGVFGEHHDEEEREAASAKERGSAAAQKRKATADLAATEAQEYNWEQLADTGKVRMMSSLRILLLLNSLSLLMLTYNRFQIAAIRILILHLVSLWKQTEVNRSGIDPGQVGLHRSYTQMCVPLFFMLKNGLCFILQLKDLTTEQLKIHLRANKLPLAGKKEILINRILTHLGKWAQGSACFIVRRSRCTWSAFSEKKRKTKK